MIRIISINSYISIDSNRKFVQIRYSLMVLSRGYIK